MVEILYFIIFYYDYFYYFFELCGLRYLWQLGLSSLEPVLDALVSRQDKMLSNALKYALFSSLFWF